MSDVFGVGNAIVDTIAHVEKGIPEKHGLRAGIMTLANANEQHLLLQALKSRGHSLKLCSGGSVANSLWALMQCGGHASYSCKVANDDNGRFYIEEFKKHGITLPVPPIDTDEWPTGTCVVMTTPDAQRTMSTHLGAATKLSARDIHTEILKAASFVYCEGYLWADEMTRAACLEAMRQAKKENITLAFTYSDPFLTKTYREDFERVTREYCDILFCNVEEARSLSQMDDIQKSIVYLQERVPLGFVTNEAFGAFVFDKESIQHVEGFSVNAIDTNGAGDAFAGGVLFALAKGYAPTQAASWGNYLGSEIVSLHGARLNHGYQEKVNEIIGEPSVAK